MPKKLRELKQILRKAGFIELAGKGSHTNWIHPNYAGKITISGQDGADAKRYQERDVNRAIQELEESIDKEQKDDPGQEEVL
jgi:predicted RNA binding protein YcfA (HicA-like mRNA interferase family)